MTVSTGTLTVFPVIIGYLLTILLFWWRFRPYFSRYTVRISIFVLVAQALMIAISFWYPKQTGYERWLWNLHEEWNIPATFASTQLAWTGGCALLIAYFGKSRSRVQRGYWTVFGLTFSFLGLDEFVALHESLPGWELAYALMGAIVVLFTLFVASRVSKGERTSLFGILMGLALSVTGAFILNLVPTQCEGFSFIRFQGCLQFYVWEEVLEFWGIGLILVSVLSFLASVPIYNKTRVRNLVFSLPGIWLLLLIANSLFPRLEVRILAESGTVQYSDGITLLGHRVAGVPSNDTEKITAFLYTTAQQDNYRSKGFSLHLVDQANQAPLAKKNEWNDRQHGLWFLGPKYTPVFRQRVVVHIPPDIPSNRAMWLVLAVWEREMGEFPNLPILTSDLQQLSNTQIVLDEFVILAEQGIPSPENALNFRFSNGFALRGTQIPDSASLGAILETPMTWEAVNDGAEDWVQFLHFVHEETGALWNHDQQPLGARLPTRLWYDGLRDIETWQFMLPAELPPGRYAIYTGLYRLSDLARLPVSDADGMLLPDARVPLGSITISG